MDQDTGRTSVHSYPICQVLPQSVLHPVTWLEMVNRRICVTILEHSPEPMMDRRGKQQTYENIWRHQRIPRAIQESLQTADNREVTWQVIPVVFRNHTVTWHQRLAISVLKMKTTSTSVPRQRGNTTKSQCFWHKHKNIALLRQHGPYTSYKTAWTSPVDMEKS